LGRPFLLLKPVFDTASCSCILRIVERGLQMKSAALLWATAVGVAIACAAKASEMTAPIEQLNAGLLQAMKAGKASPFRQRYDLLAPFVVRAVDLDIILQNGIGPSWASLSTDQQAALRTAFPRYSIATYVAHFDEFAGEHFDLAIPAGTDQVLRVDCRRQSARRSACSRLCDAARRRRLESDRRYCGQHDQPGRRATRGNPICIQKQRR